jgi:hypothetical protein
MAAPPEVKPTQAACKADLKAWSASKTGTLTITELNERMNAMFACADLSKKHEKQARGYLDEFYRTHSELANRAFNFITRHGLSEQFGVEENGTSSSQGVVHHRCQRTMRFGGWRVLAYRSFGEIACTATTVA